MGWHQRCFICLFSEQREHLLDDYDGMDPPILGPQPDYYAPMNYMPPPPAYTP